MCIPLNDYIDKYRNDFEKGTYMLQELIWI